MSPFMKRLLPSPPSPTKALAGTYTAKGCRATEGVLGAQNCSFYGYYFQKSVKFKKGGGGRGEGVIHTLYDKSFARGKGLSSTVREPY